MYTSVVPTSRPPTKSLSIGGPYAEELTEIVLCTYTSCGNVPYISDHRQTGLRTWLAAKWEEA